VLIRNEEEKGLAAVHGVNASAFETPAKASLVDALRQQAHPVVSLVATVVGHILFSPVSLSDHPDLKVMGLAPMAVTPAHQNKGVGSALVRAGVERCKELGFGAVVALGHPGYYPRFGFAPSARFGIGCEYRVPEEAFMVVELQPAYLRGKSGLSNIMWRSKTCNTPEAKMARHHHYVIRSKHSPGVPDRVVHR
jgi:putative acetyltransferase